MVSLGLMLNCFETLQVPILNLVAEQSTIQRPAVTTPGHPNGYLHHTSQESGVAHTRALAPAENLG